MKVLVTGSTSLLGGTTAQRLAERGEDVVVFQRSASGLGLEEQLGDIRDRDAVARAVQGVDAVVHVAAKVGVTGERTEYETSNVEGTANLLQEAAAAGVGRFVHVSTPSVAHSGTSLVGAGAAPADPRAARGDYAQTKATAELLALDTDGPVMAVAAIRPHLVWGPGDDQLVGRIVERARQGRLATIGSGAALVDTTYIDNAADALIAALDRIERVRGRPWVVSNAQPRPVAELVARIVIAAGLRPPRLSVPLAAAKVGGGLIESVWQRFDRHDDPPMTRFLAEQLGTAHWFDQRETQEALDWRPGVSLNEGFERLRSWFEQRSEIPFRR